MIEVTLHLPRWQHAAWSLETTAFSALSALSSESLLASQTGDCYCPIPEDKTGSGRLGGRDEETS